jgi:formylglycine-generating enzyme
LEWCSDWHDPDYYKKSPTDDPQGPTSGWRRVDRGGCWSDLGGYATARSAYPPDYRFSNLGFRVTVNVSK